MWEDLQLHLTVVTAHILNQFKVSDGLSHGKIHFFIFHRTEYNMFEWLCCLLCCAIEATQAIHRTDFILNALQWMHHSAYVHFISDWIFGSQNSKLNEISVFSQISPLHQTILVYDRPSFRWFADVVRSFFLPNFIFTYECFM